MREADGQSAMTGVACDIAVSEMFGIPVEEMCGYLVIVSAHVDGNPHMHRDQLLTGPRGTDDDPWAIRLLRRMADDLEGSNEHADGS